MAKFPTIRAELARSKKSAADLADFLGTSRQNVYNKLNGKSAFKLKDMEMIQNFFKEKAGGDFTLDYLFKSGE